MNVPLRRFMVFILTTLPLAAQAYRWTDAELRAVPEYCRIRFVEGAASAQWIGWAKRFGPAAIHMHHYCDGLLWLNRYAKTFDRREQKRILQSAYGSFLYMVPRVDNSWPLRGELYYNMGRVQALRGEDGEALIAFRKAIDYDPRLRDAYIAASVLYEKMNDNKQALTLISEGLRHVQDDERLRERYRKLGGQLPYPEPVVKEEQHNPHSRPAAEEQWTNQRRPPESTQVDIDTKSENKQVPSPSPKVTDSHEASPQTDDLKNKSYCRFCPMQP